MPAPAQDLIRTPQAVSVKFSLEPARNMINSLCFLSWCEELSGLDPWIARAVDAMTPEQLHTNRLVCEGLYYAIQSDRSWTSFPAYVEGLAAQEPILLRDRVFEAYAEIVQMVADKRGDSVQDIPTQADLLADKDTFLNYLRDRFLSQGEISVEIETEAHALLNDPSAMQDVIISHLRTMWEQYLAVEWERVRPMLQESINAFRQVDFSDQPLPEIVRQVVGTDLGEKWKETLSHTERVLFVPSAHVGPYSGKFYAGDTLGIFYGARLPEGTEAYSPALTRSELLMLLSALTDDNRLRILKLLSEEGELCAQDIMTNLELSQSAASRHLRQLSATGYVIERRREGSKCYSLNRSRFADTFQALERFLEI